jgi:hypothetical protein
VQWFYVQRLSEAPSGGTTAQYLGPFYGIPAAMLSLMGHGYYVLIYVNGTWSPISIPPGP